MRVAAVHGMGSAVTISAFATASDATTLKVTAPTPSAPMNDVVVPSLDPTLSVTMSTGEYVQAPGLQLGIERLAEEGSQSPLDGEVVAAIASGEAEAFVRGGGLGSTPGIEQVEFDITTGFPYVTVVSMIAPSPDWFVGVAGLPLIANGEWRDEVVVELFAWDAGTDDGASYESADAGPAQPISLLQRPPVQVGGAVRPFGRFIFRRIE
jgi:hypothetical protein